MRAVVQRVSEAEVTRRRRGGRRHRPGPVRPRRRDPRGHAGQAVKLAAKLFNLRVFDDADGVMNRSLADTGGAALVVSQFTLYGDTSRGRRPSWLAAARPEHAEPLVDAVVGGLRGLGTEVATGRFRADMRVALVNDGPVTSWSRSEATGCGAIGGPGRSGRVRCRATSHPTARRPGPRPPRARTRAGCRSWCPSGARPCRGAPPARTRRCAARRCRRAPMMAEKPVGATCSRDRSLSMARMRDDATCCVCTSVPVNDEPFVGLSTSSAPSSTPSRTRSPKKISQEMATLRSPAGVASYAGRSPILASRSVRFPPPNGSSSHRSGTYSPNGTRCTLS